MISEPYGKPENPQWVFDATGKAAIWSCNNLSFQDMVDITQRGYVREKLGNIHFFSCYAPPSEDTKEFIGFLDRLIDDSKKYCPVAIAEDFNAWAVVWGSKERNSKGHALLEAFSRLDLVLLNSGNKWTFEKGDKGSIWYLTFVSLCLVSDNNAWAMTNTFHLSDHRLIYWEVSTDRAKKVRQAERINTLGWKASAFVSELFGVALEKWLDQPRKDR